MPLYSFRDGCGQFDALTPVGTKRTVCPVCGGRAVKVFSVPAIKVSGAPIPETEQGYRNERDRRELKKQGWDGDRAVEHLRNSRTETAIGMGIDLKKANDREKWSERKVF